jgi:hypothetical protein
MINIPIEYVGANIGDINNKKIKKHRQRMNLISNHMTKYFLEY